MKNIVSKILILISPLFLQCQNNNEISKNVKSQTMQQNINLEKATLAGGCFWCTEAAFDRLQGVHHVQSGYAGGHDKNPTYKEVCTGNTGHAEVIQVSFDPQIISYETLLDVFFTVHDPTQLNRQGNDIGTQYRSEIFYHTEIQKRKAEYAIQNLENQKVFPQPIVTQISALNDNFYPAEDYHTDYYELNSTQPYCSTVVASKVEKVTQKFKHLFKPEYQ
ncbi:MAG: peptide-methionine (S)-S-oxide reductase MsrA [Flavobacteriaceae bacterium]|nr:peptide-methionine (S)-S-oxide reductase MsrA [Flavobacteriaceae bacterium]